MCIYLAWITSFFPCFNYTNTALKEIQVRTNKGPICIDTNMFRNLLNNIKKSVIKLRSTIGHHTQNEKPEVVRMIKMINQDLERIIKPLSEIEKAKMTTSYPTNSETDHDQFNEGDLPISVLLIDLELNIDNLIMCSELNSEYDFKNLDSSIDQLFQMGLADKMLFCNSLPPEGIQIEKCESLQDIESSQRIKVAGKSVLENTNALELQTENQHKQVNIEAYAGHGPHSNVTYFATGQHEHGYYRY